MSGAPQRGHEELGRYRVFATLGRGGMADVYLAVARGPVGFTKLVVIKRLRKHLADEAAFREMFLDEARLAARLNHPNVVQSYEVGETNGSFFIAMEYLDGQPLNRVLGESVRQGVKVDPVMAARIVADASSGLAHAHELRDYDGSPLGIIHRDVSPHNVFVTYDGQVKLMDFGIAKAAIGQNQTEVGVLKGKISYMAPEQVAGGPVDARADVFAMGIVLWELLTSKPLFNPDNPPNTMHRLLNEPLPLPSSVCPVDPGLDAITMRALEKDPQKRYASARELRDALEAWLGEQARAGKTVRAERLGGWVAGLFTERRDEVAREIRSHVAELGGAESSTQAVALDALGSTPSTLVNLAAESDPPAKSESRIHSRPPSTLRSVRPRRARPLWIGAIGVTAVLLALSAKCASRSRGPAVSAAASPSSSSPVAEVTAPPSASIASAVAPAPPVVPAAASVSEAPAPVSTKSASARAPASRARPHAPKADGSPSGPAAPPAGADPGYLTFDTYPWTRVTEGGRAVGTTPVVHVAFSPGVHVLSLDNPDLGLHTTFTVTIRSDETVTKRLGLR